MPEPARPTTPTPSAQSFIIPSSTVKKGPSIKDLIHDPVLTAPAEPAVQNLPPAQPQQPEPAAAETPAQLQQPEPAAAETPVQPQQPEPTAAETPVQPQDSAPAEPVPAAELPGNQSEQPAPTEPATAPTEEASYADDDFDSDDIDETLNLLPHDDEGEFSLPHDDVETPLSPNAEETDVKTIVRPPANPEDDPETFQLFWEAMVEAIFSDMPTLHEPLKHYQPVRKDNILIVPVKNDIQENDFALRKNQVMIYLRENWDESLDDIEVKLNLTKDTKKYILDDNDKLNALREQNSDLVDFIRSLNLRIKN